ncbi:MBL fold metallo-hydrolase [Sphingomonas sp. AAP5]|uniref:MBL fold metallo-hydrolase n=1 Tax=Sphingomonas sp. AAP5 TaxID=1523415 RepID=UPI00105718D3|nr:MBL fold metallo-hydrolase [Sphingomonas sp. AAP5]QBM75632.1 MBL fold metallo-hydrolase [Sphingomonas sp. AAP5]
MSEQTPGVPEQLEPLVARLLAPNPSPFTHTGTQVHLVGTTDLAVIDPGPDDPAHIDAIVRAIAGRPLRAIIITHTHRDHSPGSRPLAAAIGAPIVGCAPLALDDAGIRADAAFDRGYAPDRVLAEGDSVCGEGWTLTALATPGHTSNHLAYVLPEAHDGAGALFSGDHVMGWSTSIVSPPDGNMTAYMASLEKLLPRTERRYYPAHGDPIENPQRLVRGMLGHRKQREGQILRSLRDAPAAIGEMVARMYVGIDPRLFPAAERSVLAHLIDLRDRDRVAEQGGVWSLTS